MSASSYVQYVKPHQAPRLASRLGALDIELTERCPNNCVHCCINLPVNDRAARARELTTAQVREILTQAADLGCLQVRFTGGEPLIRPDFEELYLYARRLGMKVLLFTSARPLTPRLADLFARIPPLVNIEITVYGMTPESYEAATRAPGGFAQFQRGVNLLLERNVPFVVKAALLPQNRHEMDAFEAWARTIPWMRRAPRYAMNFDLRNRRDSAARNAEIASLRVSPAETVALLSREDGEYRRHLAEFAAKFMGPPGDRLFNCGACSERSGCVDAYGRLQPCMGIRAPELTVDLLERNGGAPADASIPPGRLQAALEQFQRLGELRATDPDYLARCARCFLKGLCAQCPAKAWAETGTLDTPVAYLCEVAHAQARHLGWLGEDEFGWEVVDWRERVAQTTPVIGAGSLV